MAVAQAKNLLVVFCKQACHCQVMADPQQWLLPRQNTCWLCFVSKPVTVKWWLTRNNGCCPGKIPVVSCFRVFSKPLTVKWQLTSNDGCRPGKIPVAQAKYLLFCVL